MAAVALIVVFLALLGVGAGAVVAARRRPGLRPPGLAAWAEDQVSEIDPFAVSEPWRQFVLHSLQARDQFRDTLQAARNGPLRPRLEDIGAALNGGVTRAWAIARQGHRLSQARRRVDTDRLSAGLSQGSAADALDATSSIGPGGLSGDEDAVQRSLRAQLDSARRLDAVIDDAEQQLRLLTTQLDEAVGRAAELAARAGTDGALETVAADITRASDQLEALRLALEETDRL